MVPFSGRRTKRANKFSTKPSASANNGWNCAGTRTLFGMTSPRSDPKDDVALRVGRAVAVAAGDEPAAVRLDVCVQEIGLRARKPKRLTPQKAALLLRHDLDVL